MKKLLFVALVGTFVACGEATETATEAPKTDSTVVAPVGDSTSHDSTSHDSTVAPVAADSTKK